MARKIDLSQIRKAKQNQYKPGEQVDLSSDEKGKEVIVKKPKKESVVKAAKPKPKPKKPGRPINTKKKPTRATSIRIHPDLIEIPKILAGVSRKNVFTIYNEMIIEALTKYQKKYPGLIDDLVVPPKNEI